MTSTQEIERSAITSAIAGALSAMLGKDSSEIHEPTRLFDDLGLDSTSVLELLMRLEDELPVEFDTDTLEQRHFETVGSLADYVVEQG
jgi:acyl carrier protein